MIASGNTLPAAPNMSRSGGACRRLRTWAFRTPDANLTIAPGTPDGSVALSGWQCYAPCGRRASDAARVIPRPSMSIERNWRQWSEHRGVRLGKERA